MAATDQDHRQPAPRVAQPLTEEELRERLEEEILRAERHGTQLSCLLVLVDDLEEIGSEQRSELRERTLAYLAEALAQELRRFDRIGRPSARELLVVLPGADGPRGEIVARRLLERTRAIKVEAGGARRPLEITVGLAAWAERMGGEDLIERTRAAARRRNGEDPPLSAGLAVADGDRRSEAPPGSRPVARS